jgi:uncharacterized protein (TIGR02145 family)
MKRNTIFTILPLNVLLLTVLFAVSCSSDDTTTNNNTNPPTTVKDSDSNVYHTVTIGTQVWMVENLRTTKYRNGEAIVNASTNAQWSALTTGGYCNYENTTSNAATYGCIYNWYAIKDSRNIAPTGWHVATDADWTVLLAFVGGSPTAGIKLKESGTAHWTTPNTGATNSSGFTALPAGRRITAGDFSDVKNYGYWWSSTENSASNAWGRTMSYNNNVVSSYDRAKSYGLSVRCVKD